MTYILVANYAGGNEILEFEGNRDFEEIWDEVSRHTPTYIPVAVLDELVTFDGVFVTFQSVSGRPGRIEVGYRVVKAQKVATSLTPGLFLEFLQNRIRLTIPSVEEVTILGLVIL